MLPYLTGEEQEAPRREFLYWTDGGDLAALRYDQWKLQPAHSFDVWEEPFSSCPCRSCSPCAATPFERADEEGIGYDIWRIERARTCARPTTAAATGRPRATPSRSTRP